MSIILSFDTGKNIGWSIVDTDNELPNLIKFDSKIFPTNINLENFCYMINRYLSVVYLKHFLTTPIEKILIELPEYYGSKKGKISAAKGDIFITHACAISIMNFFISKPDFIASSNVYFRTPKQWKGQLTKKATDYRLQIILGQLPPGNEHVRDSIALGFSNNLYLWNLTNLIIRSIN